MTDEEITEKVNKLLAHDEGLEDWQIDFLYSLAEIRMYTTNQANKVREIYKEVFGEE